MGNRSYPTQKRTDAEVLRLFARIKERYPEVSATIAGNLMGAALPDMPFTQPLPDQYKQLAELGGSSAVLYLRLQKPQLHVSVMRPDNSASDTINVHVQDGVDALLSAAFLGAVEAVFPAALHGEHVARVLGPEFAEFYQARDAGLLRLEGLAQKLIEDTAEYRTSVEAEVAERERARLAALEQERTEMRQAVSLEREAVERRAQELDTRQKQLDDRDSKHARRGLRGDLQAALQAHSQKFALTSDTSKKRVVVHILFAVLCAAAAVYVMGTIAQHSGNANDWGFLVRIAIGSVTFVGAIVFYIRWADQWFSRLADEELRLKRMSLDVDRASWVVETAMEWQQAHESPIPDGLVQQLGRDLFSSERAEPVRHPAEDALSAVLGATSSLKLNIPGIGEAILSKRDLKKLGDAD